MSEVELKISPAELIAQLITNGSIEMAEKKEVINKAKGVLPAGSQVYIPSLPKHSLLNNLEKLSLLRDNGFEPVPHIAARRLSSADELETFVDKAVNECGVKRMLLIGGDVDPVGPFSTVESVLETGVLNGTAVSEIGVGGYPSGHPKISQDALKSSLQAKLELADKANIKASIVTQFAFAPTHIADFCESMAEQAPGVPVYVGMPGPTDVLKLMKYAKLCGVGASMKALGDMGLGAAKLVANSDPQELVELFAEEVIARNINNVKGIHIFSFGGLIKSAKWMQERS